MLSANGLELLQRLETQLEEDSRLDLDSQFGTCEETNPELEDVSLCLFVA